MQQALFLTPRHLSPHPTHSACARVVSLSSHTTTPCSPSTPLGVKVALMDRAPLPAPVSNLLDLPPDMVRLIMSVVAGSPVSVFPARSVCRRFHQLLPLDRALRQEARRFCDTAAEAGYLNVIQWARSKGCPWNEYTCAGAVLSLSGLCCS